MRRREPDSPQRVVALGILLKQAATGKVFNQQQTQWLVVRQSPAYGWLRIALRHAATAGERNTWKRPFRSAGACSPPASASGGGLVDGPGYGVGTVLTNE